MSGREDRGRIQQILRGRGLSPGLGEGRAVLYPGARPRPLPRFQIESAGADAEVRRVGSALDGARRDLERVRLRVRADVGPAEAEIFAAHQALLEDASFTERIGERVRRDRLNAEQAVEAEVSEAEKRISALPDPYLRERAADVRDVGRRLLENLAARQSDAIAPLPRGSVVVAVELLPSETVDLDRAHVTAIVTEVGGTTSHVAILARALGIPAVTGVEVATRVIPAGTELLVDGETGEVTLWPSASRRKFFDVRARARAGATEAAEAAEAAPCATRDGERIVLLANLGRADEARQIRPHHLEGVGLFRTEFLFLDAREPPGFERQLGIYREVGGLLAGLPLTIRTLDLGGDKVPAFLAPHTERNPSLGLRGLRFSLRERHLFETQLRAIAHAASAGEVRVVFPMVLGAGDLREAKARLREAGAETPGSERVHVGAMIETPAAVFAIEEILDEVDFLSIGTNDLTQFMLAADRDAVDLLEDYSMLHPSVLRAIRRIVEAAGSRGCPVSVCGEAAGDPVTAALLVGLGVRELSLSPIRAPQLRYALRHLECRDAETLARDALAARGADEVREQLAAFASRIVAPDPGMEG